jgi:hypothetical protein
VGSPWNYACITKNGVLLRQPCECHCTLVGLASATPSPIPDSVFSRYIRTSILSNEVGSSGVELATCEDAGECALQILSDSSINGRALFVCARKWAPRGYIDLGVEDYPDSSLLQEIQEDQMRNAPVELGLFL